MADEKERDRQEPKREPATERDWEYQRDRADRDYPADPHDPEGNG